MELCDHAASRWVPGNVLRRLASHFCYLTTFTSHHHKYVTILICFDLLYSQALNEADVFKTLLFLKRKAQAVQKAPAHLQQRHIRRRSRWMYQTAFPSSRDCIGTMKGFCLAAWVQFLLMTKRNLKFLVWEPILCLINWSPPGQATHAATGAFSSLGETKLQILRPSKWHCFSKKFLCIFPYNQDLCVCVCEDSKIFGALLFWCKLPVRGILELFLVCLTTVVTVCDFALSQVGENQDTFQPLQNSNAKWQHKETLEKHLVMVKQVLNHQARNLLQLNFISSTGWQTRKGRNGIKGTGLPTQCS